MGQVIRSSEAETDLLEIWQYIATENLEAADHLLLLFNEKAQVLLKHPEMGRRREELAPAIRSIPFGNYMVFYRLKGDDVEIVRVLHGARDIAAIFDD